MADVEKHKILVVDDDPQIFKIIFRLLNSKKYQVASASNGNEALKKIEDEKPDLVILDLMMPGMSGLDVSKKIKENFSIQPIMILVLSAKDSQMDRRKCFEMGVDDYITKPFHIASLARKIEYMFEKKKTA